MNRTKKAFTPASMILAGAFVILISIAIFMTPENLIILGPLRRSLTSANDVVRNTAYFEVALFRASFVFIGILALAIGLFQKHLLSSKLWDKIVRHQVELSAVTDRRVYNRSLKTMAFLAVSGLMFIVLAPGRLTIDTIDFIIREDGVVEYSSALFFLIGSIVGVFLLVRCSMPFRYRFVLASLSFCLFVFFGEEISWGQRIFGIETLEMLKGVNVQNENNLHNLFGYIFPSLFLVAVVIYGVIFPFVARSNQFANRIFDLLGLFIASRGLAIGFLIGTLFRDWIFAIFMDVGTFVQVAEIGEMLVSAAFVLLMVEITHSLREYRR